MATIGAENGLNMGLRVSRSRDVAGIQDASRHILISERSSGRTRPPIERAGIARVEKHMGTLKFEKGALIARTLADWN
eukprot:4001135-Prymnesium_polylepis.1